MGLLLFRGGLPPAARRLLQQGINLSLQSTVVTFLFVLLGFLFGFPVIYYIGTCQTGSACPADAPAQCTRC
jgi:hypothetical protein